MTQRELRDEIFKILFEYELVKSDIVERKFEVLSSLNISKSKRDFFNNYIDGLMENEEKVKTEIKKHVKGWNYGRLGVVEKVILKMAFYEIVIDGIGHEISINEAIELAKIYGDENTRGFINGVLASLMKSRETLEASN